MTFIRYAIFFVAVAFGRADEKAKIFKTAKSLEDLMANRDPGIEEFPEFPIYQERWSVELSGPRKRGQEYETKVLTLRVWDPILKTFPGKNAPVVEVFDGEKRLACQQLDEIGWAQDVWTANYRGRDFLYIFANHRNALDGTHIYSLDPKTFSLKPDGVYFSKEDLDRKSKGLEALKKSGDPTVGEQDGSDQPATAVESKPKGKEKPKLKSETRPK